MIQSRASFGFFVTSLLLLCGCQDNQEKYQDRNVNELYQIGRDNLNAGEFSKAAAAFADVERQHPYSNWALRAQIMSAYCYYQAKKYDDAIDGFQTFIQLHPGHDNVAYAHYMIGLCYYEQIPIVQRDQEAAIKAEAAFKEVMNRFESSIYAKDARFKIDLIRDHLAGKEMDTGRHYLKMGSTLAALNRFTGVVQDFATTSHTPEALYRMVECYLTCGMIEQAKATAAVLGHNYKESKWYKNAYELVHTEHPLVVMPAAEVESLTENSELQLESPNLAHEIETLAESQEPKDARADPLASEELERAEADHVSDVEAAIDKTTDRI